jgi:hypothetical protein
MQRSLDFPTITMENLAGPIKKPLGQHEPEVFYGNCINPAKFCGAYTLIRLVSNKWQSREENWWR